MLTGRQGASSQIAPKLPTKPLDSLTREEYHLTVSKREGNA
jgi:hypothetical protein